MIFVNTFFLIEVNDNSSSFITIDNYLLIYR